MKGNPDDPCPIERELLRISSRNEIGFLKFWLPLWFEFEGRRTLVPMVIGGDPACEAATVFLDPLASLLTSGL